MTVARQRYRLELRGAPRVLGERTWLMGILNVTPDSFSDGGRFADPAAALDEGLAQFEAGADIVDVGGESTRPGASRVETAEEIRRVVPVVQRLREQGGGFVSVDTTRAEVAREALDAGADMVNDVSGFTFDPAMAPLVAQRRVPAVVMHLRGGFDDMHAATTYRDVMAEVKGELRQALARARAAGVDSEQVLVDPGIGFSKDASQSLETLRRLAELGELRRPVLVGPSRKRFIGHVLGKGVSDRLFGSAAAVATAVLGGAHVVRVHDVAEMAEVARVCDAVVGEGLR